jgi:uncharacterized protein YbbC (DUF1343 family)
MNFGLDRLLSDDALRAQLKGRRVALLAHPASVTRDLSHAVDALAACPEIELTAACNYKCGFCVKSLRPDNTS